MNYYINISGFVVVLIVSLFNPTVLGLLIIPLLGTAIRDQPKREKDTPDKYINE
jgi:hypothetical protein